MEKKIVIVAEHVNGRVSPITYELIACGKAIGDFEQGSIQVVVIGEQIDASAHDIALKTGTDVIGITVPGMDTYHGDTYRDVLQKHFKESPFDYLCVAHSSSGLDFAPGLSIRLKGACITAVEDVSVMEGKLCLSRLINGGKIVVTLTPHRLPVILTVPSGVFHQAGSEAQSAGNIDMQVFAAKPKHAFPRGIKQDRTTDMAITTADVVVAAGNGIRDQENMDVIYRLADLFPKSAVAGSRIVCDRGWMDYRQQVGVTGASVSPDLYIACGISGAAQHISGMRTSGFIVSINTDPHAAIGNISDICIVEDLTTFIPVFIEAYENQKE